MALVHQLVSTACLLGISMCVTNTSILTAESEYYCRVLVRPDTYFGVPRTVTGVQYYCTQRLISAGKEAAAAALVSVRVLLGLHQTCRRGIFWLIETCVDLLAVL